MSARVDKPRAVPRLWRFIPAIALATVVALLAAAAAMAWYVDRANARHEIDEVTVQARVLASTVTAALTFNDRNAAQEYVNAIRADPEIEAAGIYDAAGDLFVSYPPPPQVALPHRVQAGKPRFAGDRLVVVVPVTQGPATLGDVYLRSYTEPLAVRLQRYGVIGVLATMASLVVAVLGVMHVTQRRTNDELARRAEQLADANHALETQIEQREKAEEALRQAQKMEAIGQLTGGVAHDFNNLLQVILGNLERLSHRLPAGTAPSPAEPGRLIEAATRAAARAATLTQRLLAFSRRQPLVPKPLNLNGLVTALLELFGRTLGESIHVETSLAESLWRVLADENQLENALVNLVVNARDAMPAGGNVVVTTQNVRLDETFVRGQEDLRPGDYVKVAVIDSGVGMTKDVLARAFDPFFTTKDIGQGTGLGLSQVYGFVRQSGGHVQIDSTLGKGTTVSVYLPRFFALEQLETAVAARPEVPRARPHEAILLVEDEEDVRSFTGDTLQELGYEVREAPNGPAALRLLDDGGGLSLLFTDIGLPGGLNGQQLAAEARRRRPALKVLLTTGYARDAILRADRLEPGIELLVKPFTESDLARKIRDVLDR